MASFIEANSLSSITQLAGNPPRYPRNPTEQKRSSLVLYIARVPGSRGKWNFAISRFLLSNARLDVILTPMKPRLKNVTAEDVASSLFYLHLDLPGDNLLMETDDEDKDEYGDQVDTLIPTPRNSAISRKPIQQDSATQNPPNTEIPPPLPPRPDFDQRRGLKGLPLMLNP